MMVTGSFTSRQFSYLKSKHTRTNDRYRQLLIYRKCDGFTLSVSFGFQEAGQVNITVTFDETGEAVSISIPDPGGQNSWQTNSGAADQAKWPRRQGKCGLGCRPMADTGGSSSYHRSCWVLPWAANTCHLEYS